MHEMRRFSPPLNMKCIWSISCKSSALRNKHNAEINKRKPFDSRRNMKCAIRASTAMKPLASHSSIFTHSSKILVQTFCVSLFVIIINLFRNKFYEAMQKLLKICRNFVEMNFWWTKMDIVNDHYFVVFQSIHWFTAHFEV